MVNDQKSSENLNLSLGETELTIYEKARIIGSRALQIAQGAKPFIDFSDEELHEMKFNPIEVAKKEFEAGKIPISVKRNLPKDTSKVYVQR
jgi:DNA-directed RNA polymerase subunit K/omega